jgi:hypothetical protein
MLAFLSVLEAKLGCLENYLNFGVSVYIDRVQQELKLTLERKAKFLRGF